MSFELLCSCGRKLPVTAADAETEIRCPCTRTLQVPDFRTLQESHQATETSIARAQRLQKEKKPPAAPTPWFAWIFVVACGLIPVLTIGGALPTGIGVGGATACFGVAKKEEWSVAARLAVCTLITAVCWGLFLALFATLLALQFQAQPGPKMP